MVEQPDAVPAEIWDRTDLRNALASRDFTTVYRILLELGYGQHWIAAQVNQAQSEVSDIRSGRRVSRYATLDKIITGLGIPRGYVGMAYTPDKPDDLSESEDVKRRRFMEIAFSAVVPTMPEPENRAFPLDVPPADQRMILPDLKQLHALRGAVNRLNEQHGAVGNHETARAITRRAHELRGADTTPLGRWKLRKFLAGMYANLGWSATDCGLSSEARSHYQTSLGLCAGMLRDAGDNESELNSIYLQMTRTLSFAARSDLHWETPKSAAEIFAFGAVAATKAHSHLLQATLSVHLAQAYAVGGFPAQARSEIERAYDQYGEVDAKADPANLYPVGDIDSAAAAAWHAMGEHDKAVECAHAAVDGAEPDRVRSHAFRYSRLALFHLAAGDSEGIEYGRQALRHARGVRSARVNLRIQPVARYAKAYRAHDLVHGIRSLG